MKVKVRIRDDYEGHYHCGKLCEGGDVIEVSPRQAARLHELGAVEPYQEPEEEKASDPEEETPEEEVTTEGAEETPEDT